MPVRKWENGKKSKQQFRALTLCTDMYSSLSPRERVRARGKTARSIPLSPRERVRARGKTARSIPLSLRERVRARGEDRTVYSPLPPGEGQGEGEGRTVQFPLPPGEGQGEGGRPHGTVPSPPGEGQGEGEDRTVYSPLPPGEGQGEGEGRTEQSSYPACPSDVALLQEPFLAVRRGPEALPCRSSVADAAFRSRGQPRLLSKRGISRRHQALASPMLSRRQAIIISTSRVYSALTTRKRPSAISFSTIG